MQPHSKGLRLVSQNSEGAAELCLWPGPATRRHHLRAAFHVGSGSEHGVRLARGLTGTHGLQRRGDLGSNALAWGVAGAASAMRCGVEVEDAQGCDTGAACGRRAASGERRVGASCTMALCSSRAASLSLMRASRAARGFLFGCATRRLRASGSHPRSHMVFGVLF